MPHKLDSAKSLNTLLRAQTSSQAAECSTQHQSPPDSVLSIDSWALRGSVHLLCLQQGTMPCLWHLYFPVPLFMMLGNKAGWLERSGGQESTDPGPGAQCPHSNQHSKVFVANRRALGTLHPTNTLCFPTVSLGLRHLQPGTRQRSWCSDYGLSS